MSQNTNPAENQEQVTPEVTPEATPERKAKTP